MVNKAVIKINTTQFDNKGNSDKVEFTTVGEATLKNNNLYLKYEESELSGMKGTTTIIKISEENILINRFGSTVSKMEFKKGLRFKTQYKAQAGTLSMELVTNKIDIDVDKNVGKGSVKIDYNITITGLFEGKNIMEIIIN